MCVTAVSILENNPDIAIEFHVFAFFLPTQDQEILKLFENQYHTPFHLHLIDENIFSQSPSPEKNVLLLRLLMADTLRDQADRFLYLDADMVCIGLLRELIHINLDNHIAAVVSDDPYTVMHQSTLLNLETKRYFNSGFMLINIQEWIMRDIGNACMHQIITHKNPFKFYDQDPLNLVIGNHVIYLDQKFNFICNLDVPNQLPLGTIIIHYSGGAKPWYPYNINPLAQPWLFHYTRLPWKNTEQTEITHPQEMRFLSRYLFRANRKTEGFIAWILYVMMKLKLLHKPQFHKKLKGKVA